MTDYEKVLIFWQKKKITTDAELAEALNGHRIVYAYHPARLKMKISPIMIPERSSNMME